MCDHFSRVSSGGSRLRPADPVLGLLFGSSGQAGQARALHDASDAIYTAASDGGIAVNHRDLNKKVSLLNTIYENRCAMGWYAFGKVVLKWHVELHEDASIILDDPLFRNSYFRCVLLAPKNYFY